MSISLGTVSEMTKGWDMGSRLDNPVAKGAPFDFYDVMF
jgi:hypothetical protein